MVAMMMATKASGDDGVVVFLTSGYNDVFFFLFIYLFIIIIHVALLHLHRCG